MLSSFFSFLVTSKNRYKPYQLLSILCFFISYSVLSEESACGQLDTSLFRLDVDANYNDEKSDYGVTPLAEFKPDNFHAKTPTSHPYAKTITTYELTQFLTSGTNLMLINALGGSNTLKMIPYSSRLSFGGSPSQEAADKLASLFSNLDKNIPIISYCLNNECWLSYNLIIHLSNLGFKELYWYRGGSQAWLSAGLPLYEVNPKNMPSGLFNYTHYCRNSRVINGGKQTLKYAWSGPSKYGATLKDEIEGKLSALLTKTSKGDILLVFHKPSENNCLHLTKEIQPILPIRINGKLTKATAFCNKDNSTIFYQFANKNTLDYVISEFKQSDKVTVESYDKKRRYLFSAKNFTSTYEKLSRM